MKADIHAQQEEQRLRALYQSGSLDDHEHGDFDLVARAAARLCDAPQAFVAFVDRDTVWIKSSADWLPFRQMPRHGALCELVLQHNALVNVADLQADPRTARRPPTLGGCGFRMYAAVPIQALDGQPIGVLSVLDTRSRLLGDEQRDWLQQLGRQASALAEWRRRRRELEVALQARERAGSQDSRSQLPGRAGRAGTLARIEDECQRALRFAMPFTLVVLEIDRDGAAGAGPCESAPGAATSGGPAPNGEMQDLAASDAAPRHDTLLAWIGQLLQQSLRSTDTVGQLADNRFAVLLPNTPTQGAVTLADVMRGRIAHRPAGLAARLQTRFGVATMGLNRIDGAQSLLAAALAALTQARLSGPDSIAVSLEANSGVV
ncbi:sensor domain-containing diguanylate cyclase [Chitinimonas koreensis]|uniref:sensor domain-containing diguanylate cyclase n=1 Tax=Chitinimonas koreensis TaxID=356302 RepID=UPI000419EAC5|nr:GAF domain-containing protein [Chitinimonas koreensis]QNM98439.1 GAF domain-containing protein [Chitinimonas koreensis]